MNPEDILEKLKKAVHFRKMSELCILFGTFVLLFLNSNKSIILNILGVIFISVGIVINIMYWRCPSCGKHLTMLKNAKDIKKCPSCGADFK